LVFAEHEGECRMFVGLSNTPRDYAWGSRTAISELLGTPASGGPEAEYWLGTHPGSPSQLVDRSADAKTLADITTLPFIMKVLAAETSLSLQAHPSAEQAEHGFARENAEGIPLGAPERNYKDPMHKPELIYALSDSFDALCGFRPVRDTRDLLGTLGPDPLVANLIGRLEDDSSIPRVFEWLISNGAGVPELRTRVLELSPGASRPEFGTVLRLAEQFPGDVGILISLLLNLVTLRAGEAIYLPAGNIHAYQHGLGIELLAASDNVLRGGLTPKYVDVPELVSILDFRPLPVPYLEAEHPSAGVDLFRPDVADFELAVVKPSGRPARFTPAGEAILLCIEGDIRVSGSIANRQLSRGTSAYVTADEGELTFEGEGTVFVATTNPVSPPS
jgi:mannose-6-phosphate isomerase